MPVAGLAIVLGIDRIPDMMRSGTNLWGQVAAATLVDTWAGGESTTESDSTQENSPA